MENGILEQMPFCYLDETRKIYLALFLKLPGIKHLARLCYNTFAHYRFNRLEHCQIAVKKGKLNITK